MAPSRHSPSFSGPEGGRGVSQKRLVLLHLGSISVGPQIRGIRKPRGTVVRVKSVLSVGGTT